MRVWVVLGGLLATGCSEAPAPQPPPEQQQFLEALDVAIPRSDGTNQPALVLLPGGFSPEEPKRPLLVSLHSWSAEYNQRHDGLERGAIERGWIYLHPDFRGRNDDPDACGSEKAQQDILEAVAWAKREYPIDEKRVYLTGSSGGGHMTLQMAARHPDVWTAASAWVPISDVAAWYETHRNRDSRYAEMMRACTGGEPGESEAIDREYRERSPLTWLAGAKDVPLDIAAGIRDGHEGSVPIRQTLEAFNAVARAVGGSTVSADEIVELSAGPQARLSSPRESDTVEDLALGRAIYLRRRAGKARVTIFDGGHEGIAAAQLDWLERFP